jgi:DNA polymerase-1
MHVKECKTASGGVSTKDEIISKLPKKKYPVAPVILQIRSLDTIKGTFIDPLDGLIYPDGRLHTNYSHLFTWSGRTNSEDPNLQNWPKHSIWKKIRAIIEDADGNIWVVSFDYGQIEARVIAMASQDETFVQMLWDEYDVHAEWAQRLHDEYRGCLRAMGIKGRFSTPTVAKEYRQEVKNRWVFPLFFGASAYSVAGNLNLPMDVASYLYDEFWSVFEGIHEWQQEVVSLYDRRGYVETLTGRRRYAPCNYNEQINHPIQGTASDIVVDAASRLQDKGIQFNLNMHDDLTFLMPNEKKRIRKIAREMCRPTFDFINVPLVIEVEAGPNWYDQKPVGVFHSNKNFNFH